MDNEQTKSGLGADLIIPVAASAYAVYYVASVWDFPPEAQRSGIAMASLLLVLATLYFIRVIRIAARGQARFDFGPVLGPAEGRSARFAFFALTILYIFVVPYGGFTLTTFCFLLASSYLASLRPLQKAFVFAATASLGGWIFFIVLLNTRFPVGPFEAAVDGVVRLWN